MLPAAARHARRARRQVTLSLTPVLCDQLEARARSSAACAFLREIRAESHRRDIGRASRRRRGARALRRALRRAAADGSSGAATCSRALAPPRALDSSATHAVLPLLATDAGVRLQLEPGSTRTARASALGAAGSGCRSARTRRGSTRCSRRRRARDVRRPHRRARPTPLRRCAPRRARCSCRSTAPRSSSSGARTATRARRLPQLPRLAAPPPRLGQRRRRPTTRERGGRARASTRRDFVDARARGGLVVALDTELLGDWWHEGVAGSRPCARAARAPARSRRDDAERAAPRRRRRRRGATPRDLKDLERRPSPRLGAADAELPRAAPAGGARAARAARTPVQRLGVPRQARNRGRLPARARGRPPRAALGRAAPRPPADAAPLAPHLARGTRSPRRETDRRGAVCRYSVRGPL